MARRPYSGRMTSPFGLRLAPIKGASTMHLGEDGIGGPNVAPEGGGLVGYGYFGGWGNRIAFIGDSGTLHYLAHNAPGGLLQPVGHWYPEGTPLGVQGMTGTATGVHVHWETRPGGGAPIDPSEWLRRQGSTASGDTTPIEEEEEMQFISLYGLPDKGVIAPGFGMGFANEGDLSTFLNANGINKNFGGRPEPIMGYRTVGDSGMSEATRRALFWKIINMHNNGGASNAALGHVMNPSTAKATVDQAAIDSAVAAAVAKLTVPSAAEVAAETIRQLKLPGN